MPTNHLPEIGCPVEALDTPSLCIDLDVMERNIHKMANLCRAHGKAWRPHAKGHKSPDIARKQIQSGAIGLTCAKLGEAEVMAEVGIGDLLIANQVVGPAKMQRLVELRKTANPMVAVDHTDQIDALDHAAQRAGVSLRVMVEVDVGLNRAGVAPGPPAADLARAIARRSSLEPAGIMGYEGHLLTVPDQEDKRQRIAQAMALLEETKDTIEKAGIACPIVSAGGTGSWKYTIRSATVTELQAGGLIFMDAFYRHVCQVDQFDFALTLLTTVVSRPSPDRAIIDAGHKSQHIALHPPIFLGHEELEITQLSAEHAALRVGPADRELRVGDRLELVPGYGDFTSFLHNEFYATRNGRLEAIWPLAARGRLQ